MTIHFFFFFFCALVPVPCSNKIFISSFVQVHNYNDNDIQMSSPTNPMSPSSNISMRNVDAGSPTPSLSSLSSNGADEIRIPTLAIDDWALTMLFIPIIM